MPSPDANPRFKDFNEKFPLTKTLRFELKPAAATAQHINWEARDARDIFPEDRKRNAARPHLKEKMNELLAVFIDDALERLALDLHDIERYLAVRRDMARASDAKRRRALAGELRKLEQDIARKVGAFFGTGGGKKNAGAAAGPFRSEKLHGATIDDFAKSEKIFALLKRHYADNQEFLRHLAAFEKFSSALKDLKLNREHYFKGELQSGTIARRVVENLGFFARNCVVFEQHLRPRQKELKLAPDEVEMFSPRAFNRVLSYRGIEEYNRKIGGAGGEAGEVSEEGINQRINHFNQTRSKDERPLPHLVPLYRQIGAPRELRVEYIDSDQALLEVLEHVAEQAPLLWAQARRFFEDFFAKLERGGHQEEKIYLHKSTVRAVAQEILSEWQALNDLFRGKKAISKDYTTLGALRNLVEQSGTAWRRLGDGAPLSWEDFVARWRYNTLARITGGEVRSVHADHRAKAAFKPLPSLQKKFDDAVAELRAAVARKRRPAKGAWEAMVRAWREYLEAYVELARLEHTFRVRTNKGKEDALDAIPEESKDTAFYDAWRLLEHRIAELRPQKAFNKIRNYLTKVTDVPKEVRVYFSPNFLEGWSKTKLSDNLGLFVRDGEGALHLAVFSGAAAVRALCENAPTAHRGGGKPEWEMFMLQIMADPAKDIPNLMMINGVATRKTGARQGGENKILREHKRKHLPAEVFALVEKYGYGKKLAREVVGDAIDTFIEYYKKCLIQYHERRGTGLSFSFKERYDSYEEFVGDVRQQAVKAWWQPLDVALLDRLVGEGKVLLFRICNKDLCTRACGAPNTHTILFRTLFSDENMSQVPLRFMLAGSGKIFLRDRREDKPHAKMLASGKLARRGDEPVYEQHRYYERKLHFHFPVKINNHLKERQHKEFNEEVRVKLLEIPRAVLGVDRGERHLLYWALVDARGRYREGGDLNTIGGADYARLLEARAQERKEAKQQWRAVENIAKLKAGYLSHVMHFLVQKALEHDAVIALENLHFRFMQKRGGQFERSVYQQFQKALLEKLQLVIDKENPHAFSAPQLVCLREGKRATVSLQKLQGQHGIVFFVSPDYTSTTCPQCGWRKDLYLNYRGGGVEQVKKEVERRIEELYGEEGAIHITYRREEDGGTVRLTSAVDRLRWDAATRKTVAISAAALTDALRRVVGAGAPEGALPGFSGAVAGMGTAIQSGNNVMEEMLACDDAATWRAFVYYLNTLLQIRNHYREGEKEQEEVDFLQCPRCGFDTRAEDAHLKNGDAVGAYNIARKGLIALEQLRSGRADPDLYVKRALWDQEVFTRLK